MLHLQLKAALDQRRKKGSLRALTVFPSITSSDKRKGAKSSARLDGTSNNKAQLVDFSSNDYLSLASCEEVRSNFLARVHKAVSTGDGVMGSTGSRLLDGNSMAHVHLENRLAHHFDSEAALLFNSGYDANTALMATLPQPGDVIMYDSLVHASTHDGMRSSRAARRISFAHNSPKDFERVLRDVLTPPTSVLEALDRAAAAKTVQLSSDLRNGKVNVFVVVEGVYSMDGDVCPLSELMDIAERLVPRSDNRHFIVDEAHSVGVYGPRGEGLCFQLGLHKDISVRLSTFGKAFASSGAAVLCSPLIRQFLLNYGRPLVFSTALSFNTVMSIECALDALQNRADARLRFERLFDNTMAMIRGLVNAIEPNINADDVNTDPHQRRARLPLALTRSADPALAALPPSPIIPLLSPQAAQLAQHLRSAGFLVRTVMYPTVPKGQERVRICIHADNTTEDIKLFVATVNRWCKDEDQEKSKTVAEGGKEEQQAPHSYPTAPDAKQGSSSSADTMRNMTSARWSEMPKAQSMKSRL
ncbi:Serine palmitoyltransferase [Ceraceosorus bombacis]|uniref:Serine palmitoyltransferase n=1 Tax=Ceraceosorus bombacis TaxID=401625 RepID=A0A0P1B9E8_9BASI|nr:Serine palmitoyltransferase [Ceraceosorus bombacis]